MKYLFLLSFLIAHSFAMAQQSDSIVPLLNDYKFEEALLSIESSLTETPENSMLWYHKSLAHKGLFKYSEAINSAKQAISLDSLKPRYQFLLADLYNATGQMEQAIACYSGIIQGDTANIPVRMKLANMYFQQQKYKPALAQYYYIAQCDTSNWYVIRQQAVCYEKIRTEASLPMSLYRKALSINPEDEVSVKRLTRIYLDNNDYLGAAEISDQYLALQPQNTAVLKLNAYAYLHAKESKKAIEQFEKCLVLSDSSFFVYKFMGLSYYNLNDYEPSINYLEKAFNLDSTDVQTCFFLGASCGRLYFKQKGIDYLKYTIELLEPDKEFVSKVYKELATTYTSFSKYEEAGMAYVNALEYNPIDHQLLYEMANVYDLQVKDYASARKFYAMYLDSTRSSKDTLKTTIIRRNYTEERLKSLDEEEFWNRKE